MNNYQKVSTILLSFFSENSFFRLLLPFDSIVVYVCLGIQYLFLFFSFGSIGGLVSTLTYFGLILGLFYTFAKQHNRLLYIGLFLFAARELIYVIKYLSFGYYWFISWHSLCVFSILLFLGIKTYQYETNITTTQSSKVI